MFILSQESPDSLWLFSHKFVQFWWLVLLLIARWLNSSNFMLHFCLFLIIFLSLVCFLSKALWLDAQNCFCGFVQFCCIPKFHFYIWTILFDIFCLVFGYSCCAFGFHNRLLRLNTIISSIFFRSESELIHFFESRFLDESQVIHSDKSNVLVNQWSIHSR